MRAKKPPPLPPQKPPKRDRFAVSLTPLFSWISDAATAKRVISDAAVFFYCITVYQLALSYTNNSFWADIQMNGALFVMAKVLRMYNSLIAAIILLLLSLITFGSKLYPLVITDTLNAENMEHAWWIGLFCSTLYVALRAIEATIRCKIYKRRADHTSKIR